MFRTDDPIRENRRLKEEDKKRRLSDPGIPDRWDGHKYFFRSIVAEECDAPKRVGRVLMPAELLDWWGATSTSCSSTRRTPDEANAVLEAAGALRGGLGPPRLELVQDTHGAPFARWRARITTPSAS